MRHLLPNVTKILKRFGRQNYLVSLFECLASGKPNVQNILLNGSQDDDDANWLKFVTVKVIVQYSSLVNRNFLNREVYLYIFYLYVLYQI